MIDDILKSQTEILPGDILLFYGKGNGSTADCVTPAIIVCQFFLGRDNWPPYFVHTAICVKRDSGTIQLLHMKEDAPCHGQVILDEDRNLHKHPFKKPILVIRPPRELISSILHYAHEGAKNKITPSLSAYYMTLFGDSRPAHPPIVSQFNKENTCVGFITNVLQLAYQAVNNEPFPLTTDIATVKFLHHMDQMKETEPFEGWKILLVPYFSRNSHPQLIVDYMISYLSEHAESLQENVLLHVSMNTLIETLRQHYRSGDDSSALKQTTELFHLFRRIIKPASYEALHHSVSDMTGYVTLCPNSTP